MKIIGTTTPSITLSQAHERAANHGQHPVGELNIEGKRYRIVDNQVLRLNPHGGIARFREGGQALLGAGTGHLLCTRPHRDAPCRLQGGAKEPGGGAPGDRRPVWPQAADHVAARLEGEPLPGAPSLEGMRVAETDKFAEGESHISIVETHDKQRLVAKIERSVAEGHLQGSWRPISTSTRVRASIPTSATCTAWPWCPMAAARRRRC